MISRLAAFNLFAVSLLLVLAPATSVSAQTLDGRTLRVDGTDAANIIRFSIDAGDVVVVSDGNESRFALAQVDDLSVVVLGGEDTVINDTAIPMVALGGLDDDNLVGGSGDDTLNGGRGSDRLFGRDGNDNLNGGTGFVTFSDFLSGGNGDDELNDAETMLGGIGNDTLDNGLDMSGGAGDDFLLGTREDCQMSGGPGNDNLLYDPGALRRDYTTVNINGGAGVDTIVISEPLNLRPDVFPTVFSQVTIDGGPGVDTINGVSDVLLGDVNLSGAVDFLDISPFITILSSGGFQDEADLDGSGTVNFLDIASFITILTGS